MATVMISACSTLTEDPWQWLEEPQEQTWNQVNIHAVGRDIQFSVPDRTNNGGNHTHYWPENGLSGTGFRKSLSLEQVNEPFTMLGTFTWDTWWRGFYKKGGEDFYLSVGIFRLESDGNLLDLSTDQRIERIREHWISRFSEPAGLKNPLTDNFVEKFQAELFETDSGLVFVSHNAPRVSNEHQRFVIPLSDHALLDFNFYVNDLRYDQKEDPQWNRSRWEMVEKIMNTVRITPDPFGGQPEEIPAR